MTPEKIKEVLAIYRAKFRELDIPKREYQKNKIPNRAQSSIDFKNPYYHHLAHCHNMLDEMGTFIEQGRMDKVFRWLGFIQGTLWSTGIYTVEEMANHNRP